MLIRSVATSICLVVVVSCGSPQEVAEPLEPIGVFVEGPCAVEMPEGLVVGESVICGTVAVPEFHSQPDGKRLHLKVAKFPSVGEDPSPEPLFVATAGPGVSGIETVSPDVAGPMGSVLLANRDLVLVDYRGLPFAEPNLLCPEITDAANDKLADELSAEDFMAGLTEQSLACRDRLRADGITLEAFNNVETAADIAMVMTALGYDRFNVYGTSAGSILSQHLLRDHSERLASVVIDSVVPAGRGNVHTEAASIGAEMLDAVVTLCEQDDACAAAYPKLRQEAEGLIDQYNDNPLAVDVIHPATGDPLQMILTGHRVAQSILMLNTQTSTIPMMPMYINRLASGDTEMVKELLWTVAPPQGNFAWGLGTAIFCMEYSDFTEEEIVFPGTFPAYEEAITTQGFGARTLARLCDEWDLVPIDPQYKVPVRTEVPVLVLAGTLDSLTPPQWAREVADELPNALLYEVEGYGHGPTFAGECPAMMALQFYNDPTQAPDDSCLAGLQVSFAGPE